MKKIYFITLIVVLLFSVSYEAFTQRAAYTNQVINVNSGKFEFSPPYLDFVSITHYNPSTQAAVQAGAINTQSAQDVIVNDHFAYVAAQDSIVKFDINTWNRLAAVADSGLNKLCFYHNRLLISKQYPLTAGFLEVLDTADLSLVARVQNIPGECAGITVLDDSVYLAVNGGWMGTEGKLAVIDPSSWTVTHVCNFGPEAIGIFNLYTYAGKVFSVNKTPYGMPSTGTITEYNPADGSFVNHILPVTVGNGAGLKDSLLFLRMNAGLGSYDLNTKKIIDTTVISDPGALQFLVILAATVDSVTNRLYLNIGDYTNPGYCLVTSLAGDSITSYTTGVSSECIAIDYRNYPVGIVENAAPPLLTLSPNPATDKLTISRSETSEPGLISVFNARGQTLLNREINPADRTSITFAVSGFAPGIYLVKLINGGTIATGRFIKN